MKTFEKIIDELGIEWSNGVARLVNGARETVGLKVAELEADSIDADSADLESLSTNDIENPKGTSVKIVGNTGEYFPTFSIPFSGTFSTTSTGYTAAGGIDDITSVDLSQVTLTNTAVDAVSIVTRADAVAAGDALFVRFADETGTEVQFSDAEAGQRKSSMIVDNPSSTSFARPQFKSDNGGSVAFNQTLIQFWRKIDD